MTHKWGNMAQFYRYLQTHQGRVPKAWVTAYGKAFNLIPWSSGYKP